VHDRYVLHDELAVGGMATVYLGRSAGPGGFGKVVAIKRMHPHVARDAQLSSMFLDEARLAARVRHANVVSIIDVAVTPEKDLLLVMELVQGETISTLLRLAPAGMPPRVAVAIAAGALNGLEAAHQAVDEHGRPLMLVHRDVSPQNIIVAQEGIARVLDFGVAKAIGRAQTTRDGQVKGKASYMAPEQLRGERVDRRTDVYAAAIVLWEMLTGQRLFDGETPEEKVTKILEMKIVPPSTLAHGIPPALDAAILRGLSRKRDDRFATAREMARAIEQALSPASSHEVGEWVRRVAGPSLEARARLVAAVEHGSAPTVLAFESNVADGGTAPMSVPPAKAPARRRGVGPIVVLAGVTGCLALGVVARGRLVRRVAPAVSESSVAARAVASEPVTTSVAAFDAGVAAPSAEPAPVRSASPRARPSPRPRASHSESTAPVATPSGFTRDRHD
jgi:eukaryotic-like serine/threonine-protein kinase